MTKVHILGGPGSGKTTLAHTIVSRTQVPHYDLDQLGHKYGTQPAPYVQEGFAIAQQPGWITEGIYVVYIDPLLEQADAVVLLDIGWPTTAQRIIRRHVVNTLRGTNHYPGIHNLQNLLRARRYYLDQRPDTTKAVQRWRNDHAARTRPPTPESVFQQLETHGTLVIPPSAAFGRQYLAPYGEKVLVVRNNAGHARVVAHLTQQ